MNKIIPYFLLGGILCTTLLSLISTRGWNRLLELTSHFQGQYIAFNLFLFGLLLLLTRKKLFILISLFCLSLVTAAIIPWYIPDSGVSVNSPANLRILSSNINVQNQDYSQLISLVRKEKPDVAVFMEIHQEWVKQLNSLKDILPYAVTNPNPYNLGIAVYSKQPLENHSVELFGTPNNPSIVGNLTLNGQDISLIATHPPPPFKPDLFLFRNTQLAEISQYIKSLSHPVVMVGDLNITMWSSYYRRLMGKSGLKNARKGSGIIPTWPVKTNYPPYSKLPSLITGLFSIPIDHCLISPEIKVVNIRAGAKVGSDHRPLIADLLIPEKNT